MDAESEDNDKDCLTSESGSESRQPDRTGEADENESGSLFQRLDDAYLNKRSVIFNEEMFGGRERMTTDEERVLRGS